MVGARASTNRLGYAWSRRLQLDSEFGVELLVGAGRFLRELHQRLSCWLCEPVAKCQIHHWKGELKVLEDSFKTMKALFLSLSAHRINNITSDATLRLTPMSSAVVNLVFTILL